MTIEKITMHTINFTVEPPYAGVELVPPHVPGSISLVPTASPSGPRTPTANQPPRPNFETFELNKKFYSIFKNLIVKI